MLTPASPQAPVNKAYTIDFPIIVSSTHLLCPSVHFTELELPAATLEEKKRRGMGNGACMALASPRIPESNAKPLIHRDVKLVVSSRVLDLVSSATGAAGGVEGSIREPGKSLCFGIRSRLGIPPLYHLL